MGWPKMELKKYSTTNNKIIRRGQRSLKSKSFIKQTPPKEGILIQNKISKFSKTKNQTQKRPPKVPKKLKSYIWRPQIKKFYKTDPPKVVILIQNTILKFSKTKHKTQKDPLKFQKKKKKKKKSSNQKVL